MLLEADRSESAAEKLFSWARSNPNDAKTTNTILSALLQVAPTEQVIKFSAEWIKSKEELGFDSLAVLRPLLEKAPDADLICIARNLLDSAREPQLIWSILELLIRTVKEPSAIARATQLVNIETNLAFRRSLSY